MKNLKKIALSLLLAVTTSGLFAQSKNINTTSSSIEWIGKKVTGKHNGTVNFKDGMLQFKNNKLTGGKFTVNMSSLTATDLTGEYKEKLDGHLKADDFFGTAKFPTASMVFKKVITKTANIYNVVADLTIKGITKPIVFDLAIEGDSAGAKLIVDRTKYDIKYGSKSFFESLGDKAIYDDFELDVKLKF